MDSVSRMGLRSGVGVEGSPQGSIGRREHVCGLSQEVCPLRKLRAQLQTPLLTLLRPFLFPVAHFRSSYSSRQHIMGSHAPRFSALVPVPGRVASLPSPVSLGSLPALVFP